MVVDNTAEAAHHRNEEAMVACMEAQGFEYFARPFDDVRGFVFRNPETGEVMEEAAFAAAYGLGIVSGTATSIEQVLETDPNAAYQYSLSEERREHYDAARDACDQKIFGAVIAPDIDEATSEEMGRRWDEVEELVLSHPEIVAALATWRQHMSANGFEYSDYDEAVEHLEEEFNALLNEAMERGRPLSEAQLHEFQQREISFAVANLEAGGGESGIGARYQELFDQIMDERYGES